jgi:hypothetical protein
MLDAPVRETSPVTGELHVRLTVQLTVRLIGSWASAAPVSKMVAASRGRSFNGRGFLGFAGCAFLPELLQRRERRIDAGSFTLTDRRADGTHDVRILLTRVSNGGLGCCIMCHSGADVHAHHGSETVLEPFSTPRSSVACEAT